MLIVDCRLPCNSYELFDRRVTRRALNRRPFLMCPLRLWGTICVTDIGDWIGGPPTSFMNLNFGTRVRTPRVAWLARCICQAYNCRAGVKKFFTRVRRMQPCHG